MTELKALYQRLLIALVLVVVTGGLFWPMLQHPFISIDDHDYIYDNSHVTSGLTASNVGWAFTTGHASNWHPLTWISHMLDCQLFGLNPGGHHFTNLFFHAANTALLFLLLRQMTGATLRSAFVAAFFAWHPLHVESVAWASERKDVLCAFFWFLATLAYVRHVREARTNYYALALVLFGLGLMSKPMLVTFPFVLLLLDIWPLRRMRFALLGIGETALSHEGASEVKPLAVLIREKLPFFALAFGSSVVTYLVQSRGGAVSSLQAVSPLLRVENAALSYARYLLKTLWPTKLAAIYPYPKAWPVLWIVGAVILLGLISFWALRNVRRRPYLLVGWLWFLGILVPTIGLVQVGSQSMADRYMYIPAIGLFVAIVWWACDLCGGGLPARVRVVAAVGGMALVACVLATRAQLATWRSSEALFGHAINVTEQNYIALDGLGSTLDDAGRHDEAFKLFQESVSIEPRYPEGQYDLGTALLRRGELDEAAIHLSKALADNPKFAQAHSNLGTCRLRQGDLPEAEKHFVAAITLQPENSEAYYNLATVQLQQGRMDDALKNFRKAISLKPDYAAAHGNLGVTLMRLGQVEQGTKHLAEVVRLEPKNPEAHFNLGLALLDQGQVSAAESQFRSALEMKPGDPRMLHRLGVALARQKKFSEAIVQLQAAQSALPDRPEVLNELAWILATSPDARLRNAVEAIKFAERACELTKREMPATLLTLAAAYAEAGRFADAIATTQLAREIATQSAQQSLVERAAQLLKQFEAGQPFRE